MSTYPVWGWGDGTDAPDPAVTAALAPVAAARLGFPAQPVETPAPLPDLPADRVGPRLPPSLRPLADADPTGRARHSLGRSYRDLVRGIRGQLDHVVDTVLRPGSEAEVADVLDWCAGSGAAVVPFGGGTSVVGGVEPAVGSDWGGVVSLDVGRLRGVLDLDQVSGAAHVAAGTTGPALEDALRPAGWTARFYPQSFERSTVGGWVATRAAGHFSTGPTHVDDLVEAVRAVTPAGVWDSRRLPGSGAGPSPDRLLLGSEGALGVITSAWLRVRRRPVHRVAVTLAAADFAAATGAARAIVQAGLSPATCRAVDGAEATLTGTLGTGEAVLMVGFESAGAATFDEVEAAEELWSQAGLRVVEWHSGGRRAGSGSGSWRSAFVQAPYLREHLVLLGVLVETFETAVTWERLDDLVDSVGAAVRSSLRAVCGGGTVTCRLTHVYPDGAAPYFSVFAPARRGSELAQWAQVKEAATAAVLAAGGTVTHHHAVGRDHMSGYLRQRPEPFALALRAAKDALDPAGVMNPGVLLPPKR